MDEEIRANLELSDTHYRRAKNALKDKDFYECGFWCEQSVELRLKALSLYRYGDVKQNHNLLLLSKKLKLPKKYEGILLGLMRVYISSRYVTKRQIFYDRKKAHFNLSKTAEIFEWIDKQLE